MQLFITEDYTLSWDTIFIYEDRIIQQCIRVLRMRPGDRIQLQHKHIRYTLTLLELTSKELKTHVIHKETLSESVCHTTLYIALPNRRSKLEIIVQKLTELWVSSIVCWPTQRSVLREISKKRLQRLHTIALEAAEQSFRHSLPSLSVVANLDKNSMLWEELVFVAHQDGKSLQEIWIPRNTQYSNKALLIWPEWWFSEEEITTFSNLGTSISFGTTILRTETAAIVWGRILQHSL